MSDEIKIDAIARKIAERIEGRLAERPRLRIVGKDDLPAKPASKMDAASRESRLRYISSLSRAYKPCGLHLIVERAVAGRGSITELSDDEVMALERNIHRGLDCIRNDVPFEHAGLIDEGDSCAYVA